MTIRHGLGAGRMRAAVAALVLAVLAAGLLALPQGTDAKARDVKVMTRNLYLGAALEPAILAPDVASVEAAAGRIYEEMLASDFPARARLIAKEIEKRKPDLIGLQEVTRWLCGPKGDPAAARTVVIDFLKTLRRKLRRRGLSYRTAVKVRNADVEVPTDRGLDLRLIDFDAILARRKPVEVQRTGRANFETRLNLPIAGGALGVIDVPRGYVEVNAKVRGKKVHLVNTHLEAFLASARDSQADELLTGGGPLDSRRPVVLVGDLNSDPTGTGQGDSAYAYETIVASGFRDRGVWKDTCCFPPDLIGGKLTVRIDHVLAGPGVRSRSKQRTGANPRMLTAAGQWPSDHAGVFSKLRVR